MDFISVGGEARGFIAIGQHATGVIAFGQIATGVIAVGQVARGCFALGQVALGFIGWGQAGFGVLHAVGMLGAGGRGFGIVLRLVPALGKKREPPALTSPDRVYAGEPGWLELDLFHDGQNLGLGSGGQRWPIKLHRQLIGDATRLTLNGPRHVWAYVTKFGQTLVCERLVHEPPRPYEVPGWYAMGVFQFMGLLALASAWWLGVGNELMQLFAEMFGIDAPTAAL
ncbi:MAG TPA: hypothetical protein VI072_07370 [Polyangiaceae bacterium]